MYSRPPNKDLRIPHNYGGSIFERNTSTPVQDLTRRRPAPQTPQAPPFFDTPTTAPPENEPQNELDNAEQSRDSSDSASAAQENSSSNKQSNAPLLSPIGALGTEEILLIALALIIFQNGKDPDLALILLALLFI